MKTIKLRTWITWGAILFALGVASDYYFLHILFHQKIKEEQEALGAPEISTTPTPSGSVGADTSTATVDEDADPDKADSTKDNFLVSLQSCAPEIAAQAIATPEALIEYLKKSVGIAKEEVSLENFHLTLANGSQRRIHVVIADNTNSRDKKEIRLFKLDAEGYPERMPLKGNETLESLLNQGRLTRHEAKSQLLLKDGSSVELETHDQKVFEFQFNNHGKVLSCRFKECLCQ